MESANGESPGRVPVKRDNRPDTFNKEGRNMKEKDTDVIVVGTGGAGLVAAITAADEGAKVLQVDKMPQMGGTFLESQGTSVGVATKIQFEAGIYDDSPSLFYSDCMKESRAREVCDPEILMFYCQHCGHAVDWLDSLGAYTSEERQPIAPIYGEIWTASRVYRASSAMNYLNVILAEHEKRVGRGDIQVLLNTIVSDLIQEEGRIVGVRTKGEDGIGRDYKARAVILCTGGFASNIDLMRKYKFPQAKEILSVAAACATGEGLIMCQKVGTKLVNMDQPLAPYLGGVPDPDNPGRAIAHVNMDKYPGAIWVNIEGKRVVNEDNGVYIPETRLAMLNAPEMTLIVILDKKIKDENDSILVEWFGVSEHSWRWFEEKAKEGIVIKKAKTVEELGHSLGINAQTLKETIATWNGYVDAGQDLEFGRKDLPYKIENPPFYAIKTVPVVLISAGGPATNVRQQVLDMTGRVIPGLYAAGELTGFRAFGTGSLNTGCIVFGKQAGMIAAQYALCRRF